MLKYDIALAVICAIPTAAWIYSIIYCIKNPWILKV